MFEAMFRVIKESENVDERQHCFLIQAFGQASHYFSVETRQELLRLESAWHKSVCLAISHLGSKTFHVVYKNKPSAFNLGIPIQKSITFAFISSVFVRLGGRVQSQMFRVCFTRVDLSVLSIEGKYFLLNENSLHNQQCPGIVR